MNVFEDLSGTKSTSPSDNPYDALIEACHDSPKEIQSRYTSHRTARNAQQKAKLLDSTTFTGFLLDPHLVKLHNPNKYPDFRDERNCLVFWARPPEAIRELVGRLQQELKDVMPHLWLMPLPNLHMTVLEITHSLTAPAISSLIQTLQPKAQEIADYTFSHRAHLTKPMLSYDSAAVALSFVPAAATTTTEGESADGEGEEEPNYTYHHLRRDIYNLCKSTGVQIASRYTVPSAHLTIARFLTQRDILPSSSSSSSSHSQEAHHNDDTIDELDETYKPAIDHEKLHRLVGKLEGLNLWLQREYWPSSLTSEEAGSADGGQQQEKEEEKETKRVKTSRSEWIVGQEKGLDFRKGTLWYGGGETVYLGKGF